MDLPLKAMLIEVPKMAKYLEDILDEVFDSRDIIERIDEIENMNTNEDGEIVIKDEDEQMEYQTLKSIQEEAEGYSEDFIYGVQFIRNDYFEQYAEQLADEIGAIDSNAAWPLNHIDWSAAAEQLKEDYTSIDIQGDEYWYR